MAASLVLECRPNLSQVKDAYSPKAWALFCRSHFYRRQGQLVKAARDNFYSNLHVVLQIPLSKGCWPFYKSYLV